MQRQKLVLAPLSVLLIGVALVVLLGVAGQATAQNAAAATRPYTGLDMLFLIDQSGSMGGAAFGYEGRPQGNDPNNLRFVMPGGIVDILSRIQEQTAGYNRDVIEQLNVSLLAFGDATRLILNWTGLEAATSDEWDQLNADLEYSLSADRFGFVNMGNTNFLGALDAAQRQFNNLAQHPDLAPDPGERHLRALIIFTDGGPCVPSDDDPNCSSLQRISSHMAQLAANARRYFPQDYRIYVYALDERDEYWDRLGVGEEWQNFVCLGWPPGECDPATQAQRLAGTEDTSLILETALDLVEIVAPGLVSGERVEGNTFNVPPYQESFTLYIVKASQAPLGAVQLIQPDGQAANATVEGVDSPLESYAVQDPDPGSWQIDIPNQANVQGINLVVNNLAADVNLLINGAASNSTSNPTLPMYTPANFTAQVMTSQGVLPIYDNDIYPLTVELHFYDATQPDPARRPLVATVPLVRNNAGVPILNEFVATWQPDIYGTFEVRATASYVNPDGSTDYLLRDEQILPELVIQEAYFNWHAPDPPSQLQGDPINLLVDARIVGTDAALDVGAEMMFRVEGTAPDGSPLQPQLLPNLLSGGGQVNAALMLQQVGDYVLNLAVGYQDAAGNFVQLDTAPQPYTVTIRPRQYAVLMLTQPTEERTVAREFSFLPEFMPPTELVVAVEVRNQFANNTVSLRDLLGDPNARPQLIVSYEDGTTEDLTGQLAEGPDGVYTLRTRQFGEGTYIFTASVDPATALNLDYEWGQGLTTASRTQVRDPNWLIFAVAAGAGLLALALVAGAGTLMVLRRRQAENPLQGVLTISLGGGLGGPPLAEISLSNLERHTYRLRKRDGLPAPFNLITVSTLNIPENSENMIVHIQDVRLGGQTAANFTPVRLTPGGKLLVVNENDLQDQYYIGLDEYATDDTGFTSFM